jgi:hypothetical protein
MTTGHTTDPPTRPGLPMAVWSLLLAGMTIAVLIILT